MKSIIFYLLGLVVLISACNQNKEGKLIPLKHSEYGYTLVKEGKGEKPLPGNFSVFSLRITGDNGKILLERTDEENYGKFQIPQDSTGLRKGSPIDELLTILAVGDSAVLVYDLDSLAKLNPAVAGINSLIYELAIRDMISPEEMEIQQLKDQAIKDEVKAKATEKEPVVAARLAEILEAYKANTLGDKLLSTESGMKYVIEVEGAGPKPNNGDICDVHYYGVLESNGSMFDNSYQRGDYFSFPVGQGRVIAGWDEALLLMNKGTEAVFFIPYELAYGQGGRPPAIPEASNLVFYIEYPE